MCRADGQHAPPGRHGARLGVEYDTHGLTAANGRRLDDALESFAKLVDASDLAPALRAVKSPAEIAYVRSAAAMADAAYAAALEKIRPGADEAAILAALQGTILAMGGDFPANNVVIGSGPDALLCRSKSGRRALDGMGDSERANIPLLKDRHDVILHGGVILQFLLERLHSPRIAATLNDGLDGYALHLLKTLLQDK